MDVAQLQRVMAIRRGLRCRTSGKFRIVVSYGHDDGGNAGYPFRSRLVPRMRGIEATGFSEGFMAAKGSDDELRWSRLRSHNGSVQEAFEELCSLLHKYRPDYVERVRAGWEFVRKGKPDSGVEYLWRGPAGAVEAMQAKWYLQRLTASQWAKVNDSVRKRRRAPHAIQAHRLHPP